MHFFVTAESITADHLILGAEDAHHIGKVLRMRKGEEIIAADDRGQLHRCVLVHIEGGRAEAKIIVSHPCQTEPTVEVTVIAGLSKGDRFDTMIQKCVECGVRHIIPFVSDHCVIRLDKGDGEKKQRRYQRIALEASMQCNRGVPVTVGQVVDFEMALEQAQGCSHSFFLYEREGGNSLKGAMAQWSAGQTISLVTGPEGGFSPREQEKAVAAGLQSLTLGPRILRCETAPVAALCAIMYHTGNLGRREDHDAERI